MSQTTFTVKILVDGTAATGLSVLMSDPDGTYGIKRNDNDAVVVADSAAMTEIGGGVYSHTFTDPQAQLSYTGWVEYELDGETYRFSNIFDGALDDDATAETDSGYWQSIICYEDRAAAFRTSSWRLRGISTITSGGNTDDGLLWLAIARTGDSIAVSLYKSSDMQLSQRVAFANADISTLAAGGSGDQEFIDINLLADAGGISGALRLHEYIADGTCPLLVALCTDSDLALRYQGADELSAYDENCGLAAFIREAGNEVLDRVTAIFSTQLGAGGRGDWWIEDIARNLPDLRRIHNPGRLRKLCALKGLELALGREHQYGQDSAYSQLRDHFAEAFTQCLEQLRLSISSDSDLEGQAGATGQNSLRLDRS